MQSDIPRVVELGQRSLKDGPYKNLIRDRPEYTAQLALQIITSESGHILLHENSDGRVTGLLGFIIYPHYFTGEPTANEIMWYVEPDQRKDGAGIKLLWEGERMAKEMGAKFMGFTAPTEDVGMIYKRFGYKPIEVSYLKEL